MILGFLALLISFCISTIAIYFSVTGWMSLFAAEALGVMLMFGAIEIGKLIASGFLHWHWISMPKLHKWLLTFMVVVTMILTSIGIFGFLSKGHLEQETPSNLAQIKIERLDDRIKMEENKILSSQNRISQLDDIVNKLIEYDKISGPKGAKAVRKSQIEERQLMQSQIDDSNSRIDQLNDQKYETQLVISSTEAKLGPIKYIVDLFGLDNQKDLAVQLIILTSIFVFDPFAIALLLAGLWSMKQFLTQKKKEMN